MQSQLPTLAGAKGAILVANPKGPNPYAAGAGVAVLAGMGFVGWRVLVRSRVKARLLDLVGPDTEFLTSEEISEAVTYLVPMVGTGGPVDEDVEIEAEKLLELARARKAEPGLPIKAEGNPVIVSSLIYTVGGGTAMALSYLRNKSLGWAFLSGIVWPAYLIYRGIQYATED